MKLFNKYIVLILVLGVVFGQTVPMTAPIYQFQNVVTIDDSLNVTGVVTFTTDLTVPFGGTGASSFTDGFVLLGSGTGAITALDITADGAMLVGDGTTDPVAESGATLRTSIGLGAGDNVTFAQVTVDDIVINNNALTTTNDLITIDGGTAGVRLDNFVGIGSSPDANIGIRLRRAFTASDNNSFGIHSAELPTLPTGSRDIASIAGGFESVVNVSSGTAIKSLTGIYGLKWDVALSSGSRTIENFSTIYVDGSPTTSGGGSQTITNGPYSIFVDAGTVRFDGEIHSIGTYSKQVTSNTRTLIIDDSGVIGNSTSSRKFKKNIVPIENISAIYDLEVVEFDYTSDGSHSYGLIAEDVDLVMPLLVSYKLEYKIDGKDKDGENIMIPDYSYPNKIPYGVEYSRLIPFLLKAIQELHTEVDALNTIHN